MKVEFAPQARRDLISIGDYLERESGRRTAWRWTARLEARARALADHPFVGAEDSAMGGCRRLVIGPYLVAYLVNEQSVRIVRIVHGARDLPSLFPSRED